jgi:hypothetical protein
LAKRADRKELEQVKTEKAHLTAQVAAMAQEMSQKNEEIQKYHAVVFNQIHELVGNPAEIINKAHLYDQMMASGERTSAKQALPILVKYTRTMKDLLGEIQKVIPPSGRPGECSIRVHRGHQLEPFMRWWER